jgi:DeoR family deoxyribose operon repressor
MGKKDIRLNLIIETLRSKPNTSIKELAEKFMVSEMTIRRDLNHIRSTGMMNAIRPLYDIMSDYMFSNEQIKHYEQKERIAKFAVTLISPEDVLIIDSGTTTSVFSKQMPEDINFTALCYNFQVLNQLHTKPNVSIIFAGGYYHPNDQMFESAEGVALIQRIRATKMFVSASGVHKELGITCANNYEVVTKRAALNSSYLKILLVDSSKFDAIRQGYFAQLKDIDVIVTDDGISSEWIQIIKDHGIKLHVV